MKLKNEISKTMDKLLALRINKVEHHVPKPDLRYDEYLKIKTDFSAQDYKGQSKLLNLAVYSHFAIFILGRLLRRAKML
jgi:hypothetical protein